MKLFLAAAVTVVVIAATSELVLTRFVGESSERAYTTSSARP